MSDDICYATTNRQRALAAVADDVDLVLVVVRKRETQTIRFLPPTHE